VRGNVAFRSANRVRVVFENSRPRARTLWCVVLAFVLLAGISRADEPPNTITFSNNSGQDATVKLVGPTGGYVAVRNQTEQTIHVLAGRYYIVVQYCDASNHCSYNRGDSFDVVQIPNQYSEITITLNVVPDGNYHTSPATAADFGN
jgi:hypothetical protein